MNKAYNNLEKKEHAPGCTCSICGQSYKGIAFKSGYVCESCFDYIRNSCHSEEDSDKQTHESI